MNPRVVITFLICLVGSSVLASNNWKDFDANDIYPFYDTSNCVFPFTYKGKTYNNCTTDGDNGNRPWCSLTSEYVGLFTYCYDFWRTSLQCTLPFTLNGVNYTKPDFLSRRTPRYKQCRTNSTKYRFRFAIEEHVKKTGKPLLHRGTCDPTYRSMSEYHSKCAGPSDFAIPIELTDDDKQSILDTHNAYRAEVGAKSMFKLYWDDELAKMAQVHSDMCAFDHDEANNRLTVSYKWKNGQNMVMATEILSTVSDLLMTMFDSEKPRFIYGVGCNPPGTCTHYTQLMLSNMTRVGCGVTHCLFPDRIERFLTCNYIHAQYSNNFMIPYIPGDTPASDCPNTRDSNNLCDCGNKICDYDRGEELNPDTCECFGGNGKRSVNENIDDGPVSEEVLGGADHSFVALSGDSNVDSDSESNEKREMRVVPSAHGRGKRDFRKAIIGRKDK